MGKFNDPPMEKTEALADRGNLLSLDSKDTQKNSAVKDYPLSSQDYKSMTDEDLLSHYRNSKDLKILEFLLEKYDRYIASIAITLIKNMEEVKDVKQELFLKLIRELDKTQHSEKQPDRYFKKWLGRVTKNYMYDKYIRPNHPIATEVLPEKSEETFSALDMEMDFREVKNCIEELSPDQRTYIELRFFADMPNREISKEMNWAPGKTRSLRDRALPKLKKLLGKRGEELIKYIKQE